MTAHRPLPAPGLPLPLALVLLGLLGMAGGGLVWWLLERLEGQG